MPAVKFDWLDKDTWSIPFDYKFVHGQEICAIYLMEPWKPLNEFIDYAVEKHGVRRFVLVAGSSAECGKPGMENLTENGPRQLIRDQGKIYTACGQGKIPFVSATDIAAVAYRALTDPDSHNCDHRVLGPELLTYDDIAEKLSRVLGRKIEHVKLSGESRYQGLVSAGVSEYYAAFLTKLEVAASTGFETRENDEVEKVTGRPPRSFDLFAQENRSAWVGDGR
ncbi:predicted protein [Aspergillus terreus NIH2624]|uniref:NmrA-like domain-containing protein n=1 Tax=Aspergillus terreus (strain NIH 2624 / FGSC A1156) TaxID=341663 RepID=Q0CZ92_ASPTN|nr:uncharacterized protein ATEG_00992 [Aspergillus terreus NIH2624]EAU37749.1 predicted protein [Aspergillus terreus NIH2624]